MRWYDVEHFPQHLLAAAFKDSLFCIWTQYNTPINTCPDMVVLKCRWQIAHNCVNRIKLTETHSHHIILSLTLTHTQSVHASCLYRRGAQLLALCGIKWGRFPVMFLSPHPSPLQGPLMPPLPRWCLTEPLQSGMRWAAGPDMTEKHTTLRSSAQ